MLQLTYLKYGPDIQYLVLAYLVYFNPISKILWSQMPHEFDKKCKVYLSNNFLHKCIPQFHILCTKATTTSIVF